MQTLFKCQIQRNSISPSTMAEEQLEWVFDSLVEFLRGPIWNIPVLTFIEQKSVVFEPGSENEEELKKIHEAYKNLVDFMLGSYMEDLKISPEEFEKSCAVASKRALNQFHQSLFQQVWAADDFEIFKRMMTQKNLELQLQALEFLTQKRGSVPDCMEPLSKTKDEEKDIEEVIKKAIKEEPLENDTDLTEITTADAVIHEKMKQEAEKEKQLLDKAIKEAVKDITTDVVFETSKITERREVAENTVESDNSTKDNLDILENSTEAQPVPETSTENNPKEVEEHSKSEIDNSNVIREDEAKSCFDKLPQLNITNGNDDLKEMIPLKSSDERPWSEGDTTVYCQAQIEVSPLDMERRQNYLRQQRDRILAMKKQERARRLSNTEEVITQARPKSAKAARKVLREESTEVDPQTLAFRKTLAAKLRSEVVDKVD